MTRAWDRIEAHMRRWAIPYALAGFGAGIVLGRALDPSAQLRVALNGIVDGYGAFAPYVIFFVLAPSLLKILRSEGRRGFSAAVVLWFVKVRALACLFAMACVVVVFDLPWTVHAESPGIAVTASFRQLGVFLVSSPYAFAIYASVATGFALRSRRLIWVDLFSRIPDQLERFGGAMTAVVPVFACLMGLYIVSLPRFLAPQLLGPDALFPDSAGGELWRGALGSPRILGASWNLGSEGGLLRLYIALAFVSGGISALWHLFLLARVRWLRRDFSLPVYLRDYLFRIYPVLFATSSESLATPLNLHLIRKMFPAIHDEVRRFTIGTGSILNINGTLTCCFVMVAAVCAVCGLPFGVFDLLLCAPVIFLVGFGVPGIPGELVLFAGPILSVLGVPEAQREVFLAAFLGLQIGLPDAFRTGANSIDDLPAVLILDHRLATADVGVVACPQKDLDAESSSFPAA